MKKYDIGSSIFWFFFSILVCIGSLRLGIGSLRNPEMGFITFGASALLGILSLTLLIKTFLKKEEAKGIVVFSGTFWKRIVLALIALLIYAKLMPSVGYLISTFFLMSFLFWIAERQKVWWILILSFLTTIITYYVFSKLLNFQFPAGPFEFR